MEDFLIRDTVRKLNPYLLFALLFSLGFHLLLILPRWLSPAPQSPAQITVEVRLSPRLELHKGEQVATVSDLQEEESDKVESVQREELETKARSSEELVEPTPNAELQQPALRQSIQQVLESIHSAEENYRLPGSSGLGNSAFDPSFNERISASERFNKRSYGTPESFRSYSEPGGAQIVEMANGSCFRVGPGEIGAERAWAHVPCSQPKRLRLNPENHLNQVGR